MLRRIRFYFARHRFVWLLCLALCGLFVWATTIEMRLGKMAVYDRVTTDLGVWEAYRPHPTLFWTLRPNLNLQLLYSEYACSDPLERETRRFSLTTNSWGMRNPDTEQRKMAQQWRILCLGDELTFGYGVDDNQTYESQLQRLLRDARPQQSLQVLNGGCPGWSTYQMKEWTRLMGRAFQPDLYIIGFSNADFSLEDKSDSERVSSFAPWRWLQLRLFDSHLYMYRHRLNAELYNPYGLPPVGYQRSKLRVPKDEYRSNLMWLTSLAASDGAKVAFLDIPCQEGDISELNDEYRQMMREVAQQSGALYVDVQKYLVAKAVSMTYLSPRHPNANGYKLVAASVVDAMKKRGWQK